MQREGKLDPVKLGPRGKGRLENPKEPGVRMLLQVQASRPGGRGPPMKAEALGSSLATWANLCDSVSSSVDGDQALASK